MVVELKRSRKCFYRGRLPDPGADHQRRWDYKAGDLKSETARWTISGLGGATIWATESLDVTISRWRRRGFIMANPPRPQDISGWGISAIGAIN
jgi:hypothetical protein